MSRYPVSVENERTSFATCASALKSTGLVINFRGERSTLVFHVICILFLHHVLDKIPTWKLFKLTLMEKSKAEKKSMGKENEKHSTERDKRGVSMRCFSQEILNHCHRRWEVLLFHWFAVLSGVIISRRGASCSRTNPYKRKSHI